VDAYNGCGSGAASSIVDGIGFDVAIRCSHQIKANNQMQVLRVADCFWEERMPRSEVERGARELSEDSSNSSYSLVDMENSWRMLGWNERARSSRTFRLGYRRIQE